MKKLLFKILAGATFGFCMLGGSLQAQIPQSFTGTTNGFYLISTNRASVYQVVLSVPSGQVPSTVTLYDCDSIAAPFFGTNYTNAAFTNYIMYSTTMVSSYVGTTGITNWYTNVGQFSLAVSNRPNTNVLPPIASFTVAGGATIVYNVDALFARGICAAISSNITGVINYRTGR